MSIFKTMTDPIFKKAKTEIKKLGDIGYINWLDKKYRFIKFEIQGHLLKQGNIYQY